MICQYLQCERNPCSVSRAVSGQVPMPVLIYVSSLTVEHRRARNARPQKQLLRSGPSEPFLFSGSVLQAPLPETLIKGRNAHNLHNTSPGKIQDLEQYTLLATSRCHFPRRVGRREERGAGVVGISLVDGGGHDATLSLNRISR